MKILCLIGNDESIHTQYFSLFAQIRGTGVARGPEFRERRERLTEDPQRDLFLKKKLKILCKKDFIKSVNKSYEVVLK